MSSHSQNLRRPYSSLFLSSPLHEKCLFISIVSLSTHGETGRTSHGFPSSFPSLSLLPAASNSSYRTRLNCHPPDRQPHQPKSHSEHAFSPYSPFPFPLHVLPRPLARVPTQLACPSYQHTENPQWILHVRPHVYYKRLRRLFPPSESPMVEFPSPAALLLRRSSPNAARTSPVSVPPLLLPLAISIYPPPSPARS